MASSPYFAAIDLGSNSFHMIIARLSNNQIEIIDREKDMVQIARGLSSQGELDQEAQARALTCLSHFAERLRDIPKSNIRAVGTKTLRAANNSDLFLQKAEANLGHSIEIISGYEEARLVYQGLSHSIVDTKRQRLVIDIGGGSTEFILGQSNTAHKLESLSMGCVAYSNLFFTEGTHPSEALNRAYMSACAELEAIRRPYLNKGWEIAFGTSGTMKAVATLLKHSDGAVIRYDDLCLLMQRLIEGDDLNDEKLPILRRAVLPAGIAIIKAICDQLNIDHIHVSDASLKDGLIHDTIGRLQHGDVREQTVKQQVTRYDIDTEQAERVNNSAMQLWQQVKQQAEQLPAVSRTKVLRWAAMLHECGLSISHSNYHKHAHYLIKHSDLAGFARFEQFCIASLLRFQRKKIRPDEFASIDSSIQAAFIPLLLCLRLSLRLNRRRETLSTKLKLRIEQGVYILSIDSGWLALNPLTRSGLLHEVTQLEAIGVHLLLEEAL
ncbi:Ppx/GppA family phosphatase [Agaribacterium sp. ZY112]|uniref:Ppx/GppA phosphatase family protein n=1 Tax=Agaribacterium sp. ZY112 TaxID=3233574 RepID=UPI003524A06E